MLECRICGCKFDVKDVDRSHCNCGFNCGGINAPCPNCGFDVLIPKKLRKNEANEKSIVLSKIKNIIR